MSRTSRTSMQSAVTSIVLILFQSSCTLVSSVVAETDVYPCSGNDAAEKQMTTQAMTPGISTTLDCQLKSNDILVRRIWIKDHTIIHPLIFPHIHNSVNGSLSIKGDKSTEGTYICLLVTNTSVTVAKAVRLYLEENTRPANGIVDPLISPQTPNGQEQSLLSECRMEFKEITDRIGTQEGTAITLRCDVEDSRAVVTWYRGGQQLIYDSRRAQVKEGILQVKNSSVNDSGLYTCVVQVPDRRDCTASKDIELLVVSSSENLHDNSTCGKPLIDEGRRQRRIIDGVRSSRYSAPWMGMVWNDANVICGCSLIDKAWVITAAHCLTKDDPDVGRRVLMSIQEIKDKFVIKVGKIRRRQLEPDEVTRKIRSVVVHPEFARKTFTTSGSLVVDNNDIALIQLDGDVPFKPNILPICLPPKALVDSIPIGTLGVVTGWGRVSVSEGTRAFTLQEARLPLVSRQRCQEASRYIITENMFCAGFGESYSPDTCAGDSGGPYSLNVGGRWHLAGVISWGEGCSTPLKYGVYTKVENYVDWIYEVINKH